MWTTLAILAGAMTGTSALLAWMDPTPPPAGSMSEGQSPDSVHTLIAADVPLQWDQWDQIEVAPSQSAGRGPMMLAARASEACHFRIDESGRPSRCDPWRRQATIPGQPGVIRIKTAQPSDIRITEAQRACLINLIESLKDLAAANGRSLQVISRNLGPNT